MAQDENIITVAERVAVATNTTSSLRSELHKTGAVDVLGAMGMMRGRNQLGAALLRLVGEHRNAKKDSDMDAIMLMNGLKSLKHVIPPVTEQAAIWGIARADKVALAIVAHWLERVCTKCDGVQKEKIANTPATSAKNCHVCRGSGEARMPYGSAGADLFQFLVDCSKNAEVGIGHRLNANHG